MNPSIFPAMRRVKQLNGSWIVDAQIISHQEKVISSITGTWTIAQSRNQGWKVPQKLRDLEQLSDIARCLTAQNHCRSEICYMFQRRISSCFCWLPWDNKEVCAKQQKRVQPTPKSGKLHSFDMVLAKNQEEVPRVIIATLSDHTLWHRRMGHAH